MEKVDEIIFQREFHVHAHVKMKVLQSFTSAPPRLSSKEGFLGYKMLHRSIVLS